jgi:NAD(P)-dependent dehydrogenase (short-subunit alcohol dehydrogenase family)
VAIVTGAASGMGRAVATRFLDEGWIVVALDLREPELDAIDGRLIRCAPVDVCDRDAVRAALRDPAAEAGPVRAVLNVAGIYPPTTLADTSREGFRSIFETNVLGTLNVIAESVELIRAHGGGGSIVNFASVDAFAVSRGQLLYSAAKAAVVSITRSLAVELAGDDITVNAVAPGWVDTPGNRATGRMDGAAATVPLGRVARPEEIAEWTWRLAGESSSYMTGETLVISGGSVMR